MKKNILSMVLAVLAVVAVSFAGTYSGGDGSVYNPYSLQTAADIIELSNTQADWVAGTYFKVDSEIDLAGNPNIVIGDETNPFDANFDGKFKAIKNYTWNAQRVVFTGLFGVVGPQGYIQRVSLEGVNIAPANTPNINFGMVGAVAGRNEGVIVGAEVVGGVVSIAQTGVCVGGVVGENAASGVVENASFAAMLTSSIYGVYLGGVVGQNFGEVSASALDANGMIAITTAPSTQQEWTLVGGVVGFNIAGGSVLRCQAQAGMPVVIAALEASVGGVVGYNAGTVRKVTGSRDVIAQDDYISAGGVAGVNTGLVYCSTSDALVAADTIGDAGGIAGLNEQGGIVEKCSFTGNIDAGFSSLVGGITGRNFADVVNSYAQATIAISTAARYANVGGISGQNAGSIANSYSASVIDPASQGSAVGGLLGWNDGGTMTNCFYDSDITTQTVIVAIDDNAAGTATSAGATTTAMLDAATYTNAGWDLGWTGAEVWTTAGSYPVLYCSLKGKYSGGLGTAGEPYLISVPADVKELYETQSDWAQGVFFLVTANIDMSGYSYMPIGRFWNDSWVYDPTLAFNATFDGNGKQIYNYKYEAGTPVDPVAFGFFGVVGEYGTVKNLGVTAYVTQTGYSHNTGILAGVNLGTIEKCWASGSLWSVLDYAKTGGLVAVNGEGGKVLNCYTLVDVAVTGNYCQFGALVGDNYLGTIENCYAATATVYNMGANNFAGALVGVSVGSVFGCFNEQESSNSLPMIGGSWGTVSNNYTKTTAEMLQYTTYTDNGWDLGWTGTEIWTISGWFPVHNAPVMPN